MSGAHNRKAPPEDFTHWASIESWTALRARYRQCTSTLQRWIQETGAVRPDLKGSRAPRPMPDDFAERAARHTNAELMAHYTCGSSAVYRWRAECGVEHRDPETIPDDFAERWKTTGILKLAKHYGKHTSTITLWIKRLGLSRPPNQTLASQRKAAAPKAPKVKAAKAVPTSPSCAPAHLIKPDGFRHATVHHYQRDTSAAGMAAETLQRDRWTVFRCNEKGRQDIAGKFWMCGRVLCTDAELIERAERAARRMAA